MWALRAMAAAVALAFTMALTACVPTPGVTPIAVNASDLQGETVTVALNQILYIDTDDLDVDVEQFVAEIADESIVTFESGAYAGDFLSYPGFTPLKVGNTTVTLTNDEEQIQPLKFTIQVTPAPE